MPYDHIICRSPFVCRFPGSPGNAATVQTVATGLALGHNPVIFHTGPWFRGISENIITRRPGPSCSHAAAPGCRPNHSFKTLYLLSLAVLLVYTRELASRANE